MVLVGWSGAGICVACGEWPYARGGACDLGPPASMYFAALPFESVVPSRQLLLCLKTLNGVAPRHAVLVLWDAATEGAGSSS